METFAFALLIGFTVFAVLGLVAHLVPHVRIVHGINTRYASYPIELKQLLIPCAIAALFLGALSGGTLAVVSYVSTTDTEYLHGVITDRQRTHDSYVQEYECNCVCVATDKSGSCTSTVCQTCYEDHYTVSWDLKTTVGNYCVDSLDRTYKSVYDTPDPTRYVTAQIGNPFTRMHNYTNYFLLSPKSALTASPRQYELYANQLANYQYPSIYNEFDINLVVTPISDIPSRAYNEALRSYLIKAGNNKQANVILVFTPELNPSFRYALERQWRGGRKNDIIIMMGVDHKREVQWADVITLGNNAGNELLASTLRAELIHKSALDVTSVMATITQEININFTRRAMSNYEYIAKAQRIPLQAYIISTMISLFGLAVALWILLALPNPFIYIKTRILSCVRK